MGYSPLSPLVYAGNVSSYFGDDRPDIIPGRLQSVQFREGWDGQRPFQRFQPSRVDVETIIPVALAKERPFLAGQLIWLQVGVGTAAPETWFRGVMLTPKYDNRTGERSYVQFSALDLSDALNTKITIDVQSDIRMDAAIGMVLDAVGWPSTPGWRDISTEFLEMLSSWSVPDQTGSTTEQTGFEAIQDLMDAVGPPARMIVLRSGGLKFIKDVETAAVASFTEQAVTNFPELKQDEQSVVTEITFRGTTVSSFRTNVGNRRPLTYRLLTGFPSTEFGNVSQRIFAKYQNGLNLLSLEFSADDDRAQGDVVALLPGDVIEYDSEFFDTTWSGPVGGVKWSWQQQRRAKAMLQLEVDPPTQTGGEGRLYATTILPGEIHSSLIFIDVETGIGSEVLLDSDIGVGAGTSLAYDPNNDIVYLTNNQTLYRLNPITSVATEIGSFGSSPPFTNTGLAYDSINDVLYACGIATIIGTTRGVLATLDVMTGAKTLISANNFGAIAVIRPASLAFDSNIGLLYMGRTDSPNLYSVDQAGVGTLVFDTGLPSQGINALTYDPIMGHLYGSQLDRLYAIDPFAQTVTRRGTVNDFGFTSITTTGFAFVSLGSLVLDAPTGLMLTESGGDIAATWNAVTDATGYVLEWREEGSGDAWQTVDVSAPPHTFTP